MLIEICPICLTKYEYCNIAENDVIECEICKSYAELLEMGEIDESGG